MSSTSSVPPLSPASRQEPAPGAVAQHDEGKLTTSSYLAFLQRVEHRASAEIANELEKALNPDVATSIVKMVGPVDGLPSAATAKSATELARARWVRTAAHTILEKVMASAAEGRCSCTVNFGSDFTGVEVAPRGGARSSAAGGGAPSSAPGPAGGVVLSSGDLYSMYTRGFAAKLTDDLLAVLRDKGYRVEFYNNSHVDQHHLKLAWG